MSKKELTPRTQLDPEKEFELQSDAIMKYREIHFGLSTEKPNVESKALAKRYLVAEMQYPDLLPHDKIVMDYLSQNFDRIHEVVMRNWESYSIEPKKNKPSRQDTVNGNTLPPLPANPETISKNTRGKTDGVLGADL